jgi:hypothetical protein
MDQLLDWEDHIRQSSDREADQRRDHRARGDHGSTRRRVDDNARARIAG